jgi:hypothetical protein
MALKRSFHCFSIVVTLKSQSEIQQPEKSNLNVAIISFTRRSESALNFFSVVADLSKPCKQITPFLISPSGKVAIHLTKLLLSF